MPYICDRCSMLCSDLSTLKVHMRKHTKEKPFCCPICNHQFAQKGNLNTHIHNVHNNQKQFVCHNCSKQFAQRKTLIKHQMKCGKQSMDIINSNQNLDNISDFGSQAITSTLAPLLSLETSKIYPLGTEDKSSDSVKFSNEIQEASDSTNNVRKEQHLQIFVCNKCDMSFKSKDKLVLHTSVHDSTAKPFVCHICGKGFNHKGSMNSHVRFVHKGEKPFPCSVCLKKFSNKCHLKLHMRIHTNERHYECETCRKTFVRIEHYRYHLKTHSKRAEIFGCTMCNASFSSVVKLRKHREMHLKEKNSKVDVENAAMQSDSSGVNEAVGCLAETSFKDSPSIPSISESLPIIDSVINRDGGSSSDFKSTNVNKTQCKKEMLSQSLDEISSLESSIVLSDANQLGKGINQEIINNFASLNLVYDDKISPTPFSEDTSESMLIASATCESLCSTDSIILKPLNFNDFVEAQSSHNVSSLGLADYQSSQFHLIQDSFQIAGNYPFLIVLSNGCGSISPVLPVITEIDCNPVEQTSSINTYALDNYSLSNSNIIPAVNLSTLIPEEKSVSPKASTPPPITTTQEIVSSTKSSQHQLCRCTECDKKFSSFYNLLSHMRVHSGEKPYQCDKCFKRFTQTSSLKFHTSSVHGGEKKYECSSCLRCFSRRSHLKRHSFIHTNEKPYRCPVCDRHFIEKGKLRSHFISHDITGITLDELLLQSKSLPSSSTSSSSSLSSVSTNLANGYSNDKIHFPTPTTISAAISSESIDGKQDNPLVSFKRRPKTSLIINSNLLLKPSDSVDHNDIDINNGEKVLTSKRKNILKNPEDCNTFSISSSSYSIMTRSKTRPVKCDDLNKDGTVLDCGTGTHDSNNCNTSQRNVKKRKNNLEQDKFINTSEPVNMELLNATLDKSVSDEACKGDAEKEERDDHNNSVGLPKSGEYSNPSSKITPCTRRKPSSLKCEQCGKSFNSLAVLRIHSVVHSGLKPHKCDICEKSFTQNSSLKVHMSVIHKNTQKYKCPRCPKEFSQKSHMKRHLDIHMGLKPFICDICDKRFQENNKLLLHMKKHDKAAKNDDEEVDNLDRNQFVCKLCSKVFLKKSYLNKHLVLHGQMNVYQCDKCSKQYRQKSSLDVHMRIHTGEKPFSCKSCNKTFSRRNCLIAHRTTHLSIQERVHACSICSQRFARISSLFIHLRKTHDKSGLEQVIKDRKDLQMKKKLASLARDPRPFACNHCSKRFCYKSTLDIHSRVHSREKPFVCPICQCSFTQKGSLKFHMKVVHNDERLFQCNDCNQKFTSEKRLKSHMSIAHPDKTSISSLISKIPEDETVTFRSILNAQLKDYQNVDSSSDLTFPPSIRTCINPMPGIITQRSILPSEVTTIFSSMSPLSSHIQIS